MKEYCKFCGKELQFKILADKSFCDDLCRSEFHNRQRKIDRRIATIIKAYGDLNVLTVHHSELRDDMNKQFAQAKIEIDFIYDDLPV